jgi:hypothetical protein
MATFAAKTQGPGAPLASEYQGQPVIPSDSVDLPVFANNPTAALFITGAGNVAVNLPRGGTAVLSGLPAGHFVDIAVSRVLATGTTATGIFQLSVAQYS